jgi:arylformamidase
MAVLSSDTDPPHRGLSLDEIERQYQPSLRIASLTEVIREYGSRGAAERAAVEHRRLTYGDHPDEWLWYAPPPEEGAPLHVFVHGGYWRRLSADDGTLSSSHFHRHGAASASLNYSLCPLEPLPVLVDQVRRALRWLVHHAGELGHSPRNVHVTGHSAGAHLAAMAVLATDVELAGATLVSGIFDLTPIPLTTINDDARLDNSLARELSPLAHLRQHRTPITVAVAEHDTDEFRRQSLQWAAEWAALPGNTPPVTQVVLDRHHFDIVFDLADPDTTLGHAVLRQMGLA